MSVNIYDPATRILIPLAGSPSPDPIEGTMYWIGITETPLTDGSTTRPIIIATYGKVTPEVGDNPSEEGWYEKDSESITGYKPTTDTTVVEGKDYYTRVAEQVFQDLGGVAEYNNEEFIYNGYRWQSLGDANLGLLAHADFVSASYQPEGTVDITEAADTTVSVTPFGSAGTLPFFTMSGENAIFNPGTAATAGEAINVVTASGARTATFSGTSATIESTAQ